MGGKHSKTKGHSFERFIANELKKIFPNARRQLEYHIDDCQGVDIMNTERFKFQCKKLKGYAPVNTIKEIICDKVFGDIPVVVTAADGEPPVAILFWDDFLTLLETYSQEQAKK